MKKILALILALVMVLALCACGAKEEAPAEAPAAPAEAPAAPAEAPAAPAAAPEAPAAEGDASGEMGPTGEMPPLAASGSYTITVDGVTDEALFSETDNGDQETKGIVITWQGVEYTGKIDKGVYTADDAAAQPIFDAYKTAFEANNAVGPASGEPSAEPAA